MNELTVIEQNGARVLTTTQLSEAYGADKQQISKNFTRNMDRYREGKHYFLLTGDSKREFLNRVQIDDGSKNASVLYLWTEKGAWLHAKSLNTDEAWEAYETLVDDYYRIQEKEKVMSPLQMVNVLSTEMLQHENRLDALESTVNERMTVDYSQQLSLENAKRARVIYLWENGVVNKDVHDSIKKVYAAIGRDIKNSFAVNSYRNIRQKDFDEAISYIKSWRPKLV